MQNTIVIQKTDDPMDAVIQIMDHEEIDDPQTYRSKGRPTMLAMDHQFLRELRQTYERERSIRRTATALGISPTTVKKYLGGAVAKVGRPVQPKAWTAQDRTSIHKWFVNHKDEPLPLNTPSLAKYSGFKRAQVTRYLRRRHDAVLAYLQALPDPRDGFILFEDTLSRRLPSPLIKSFTLDVDRFTLVVTMNCLLKAGGVRLVKMGFKQYVDKLTGKGS